MDHFNVTAGILDSCNLLNYPRLDTYIDRNKEIVHDSNLKRCSSSTSVLLRKTSHTPDLNNITAGYYPPYEETYRHRVSPYEKPFSQVTEFPKSPLKYKRRKVTFKKTAFTNLEHSINSNNIYLLLPGRKNNKVYAINTANAKIFKEINFHKILSECIIKSYIIREMNKNKKKNSDKVKEKEHQTKWVPECSPGCAYKNEMNKTQNVWTDRPVSASGRSPVKSSYKIVTTTESVSTEERKAERRQARSPDRVSLTDAKTQRSSRQKTKINNHQMESNRKDKSPDGFSFLSDKRSIESIIAETKRRSPERFNENAMNSSRLGRIKITGRLGLTEDDKYVLKCNASLDGEPLPTHYQGAACALLPQCVPACEQVCRSAKKQRDANVQANDQQASGVRFFPSSPIGKESQATQVDFQILYPTANQRKEASSSKINQKLAYANTTNNDLNISDNNERTCVTLNKLNSPILVISIYPNNEILTASGQQNDNTTLAKKNIKKNGRSRSPSPAKNSVKLGGRKSESRVNASSSKKTVRDTARKETKTKLYQSKSKTVVRSTSPTKSKMESKTNKIKSSKLQNTPPQSRRTKSPQRSEETTTTEKLLKKALIDDFTKKYTEQITQRNANLDIPLQTKHNVSNITIDIEGDSDYYNVKLAQDSGKINTELTVRKPTGGKKIGRVMEGETDTTSLENFLYMQSDEEPRKRSFSQTLMFDGTDMTMNSSVLSENELTVKDSIEISHRREHRASLGGNLEKNDVDKEVGTECLARRKHFQGDDCSVGDRSARDKEIKKLLGIDKGIKKELLRCRCSCSKSATLIGKCSQVHLRSVYENYSRLPQTKNTMTNPENLNKNKIDNSLLGTVKTVTLNRPLYQTIWNQNVQLLYQLNWRKQRPIILTRHQYARVKRTIYSTLIQKHDNLFRAKWYNHRRFCAHCFVTGESKSIVLHYDKSSQTEGVINTLSLQTQAIDQLFAMRSDTYIINDIKDCGDASPALSKEKSRLNNNSSHGSFGYSRSTKWAENAIKFDKYMHNIQEAILITQIKKNRPLSERSKEYTRKANSVKEIQCQTVSITRQRVKFSSSDTVDYISRGCSAQKNESCSIHTIYKNHRKSVTPNLGTSDFSLCQSSESRWKLFEDSINYKLEPKKPFLRRLISCLVFKISPLQPKTHTSTSEHPNSSFDSYHISTSLGAIEMSSSLYDTTASFYSDHTVRPVAKTKRGFFNSVRGFLVRKS